MVVVVGEIKVLAITWGSNAKRAATGQQGKDKNAKCVLVV